MGTRHLIAVKVDGDYKVAQYGQWDGYPEGQGTGVLAFLRGMERAAFLAKVRATHLITPQEMDEYGARLGSNWAKTHPWLSRDAGSDILGYVMQQPDGLWLKNSIDFAGDSLFCEFAYVIDFDTETFEVFKGFNKEPVPDGARFTARASDGAAGYEPVRLWHSWPLSALPTEEQFLATFRSDKDDEDES